MTKRNYIQVLELLSKCQIELFCPFIIFQVKEALWSLDILNYHLFTTNEQCLFQGTYAFTHIAQYNTHHLMGPINSLSLKAGESGAKLFSINWKQWPEIFH